MAEEKQGAHVPVAVNTAEALARLRELELQAARTRAALQNMPAASTSGANNPSLPPVPTPAAPGSKADDFKASTTSPVPPAVVPVATRPQKSAVPTVPTPRTAPASAGSGARASMDAATPSTAGADAKLSAMQQHQSRLHQEFAKGPAITNEGLKLGPLTVGADGFSLRSAFTKTVGPAAGYMALAYVGLKAGEGGAEFYFEAVSEAAERGVPINQVLAEKASDPIGIVSDVGGGLLAGTIGAADTLSRPLRTITTATIGLLASLGRNDGMARDMMLLNQVAQQNVDNLLARLRGEKTTTQIMAAEEEQWQKDLNDALAEASRDAKREAQKAAEQLMGMGFPGTLDELKGDDRIYRAFAARHHRELEQLVRDQAKRTSLRTNGKTG